MSWSSVAVSTVAARAATAASSSARLAPCVRFGWIAAIPGMSIARSARQLALRSRLGCEVATEALLGAGEGEAGIVAAGEADGGVDAHAPATRRTTTRSADAKRGAAVRWTFIVRYYGLVVSRGKGGGRGTEAASI